VAFAENALYWILANGIPAAIGALVALAHPLTVATAFVAAPITSLTPVIGAGYVTALVQAWLRPPRVRELEQMADDAATTRGWWSNRMLKILLAFILPGLGSMLGTFIGGFEIFSNLK
jgi:pheromone shutdown protein TraB